MVAPDRVRWQVGREWAPVRVRLRDWDWREAGPGDVVDAELGGLAIFAVAMLVFLVIFPIVAIALELILLVLMCLIGVMGRVLLRRPWTVVARSQTTGSPRQHRCGWSAGDTAGG